MKKFIKFSMGLILLTLMVVGAGTCQSCQRHRYHIPDEEFKDKLDQFLPEALKNVSAFTDVTDVMIYRQNAEWNHYVDSVFLQMTDQEIANVFSVLRKQMETVRITDIVHEYNSNRRIYRNLPSAKDEKILESELQNYKKPDSIQPSEKEEQ
jgi:hypothetical protein